MSEVLLSAALQHPANQGEVPQFLLRHARDLGVIIPTSDSVAVNWVNPRNLDRDWARQADLLSYLFARRLGFSSRDEYIEELLPTSFPPFVQTYQEVGVVNPVLVQVPMKRGHSRLTLEDIAQELEINLYGDVRQALDWENDQRKFKTPSLPYSTWVDDGTPSLGKSVRIVRDTLIPVLRGGTYLDVIALKLKEPQILKSHYLDCPGSQVGSANAPFLCLWDGRPGLDCRHVDGAGPDGGSVLAGRDIVTQKLVA